MSWWWAAGSGTGAGAWDVRWGCVRGCGALGRGVCVCVCGDEGCAGCNAGVALRLGLWVGGCGLGLRVGMRGGKGRDTGRVWLCSRRMRGCRCGCAGAAYVRQATWGLRHTGGGGWTQLFGACVTGRARRWSALLTRPCHSSPPADRHPAAPHPIFASLPPPAPQSIGHALPLALFHLVRFSLGWYLQPLLRLLLLPFSSASSSAGC